MDIVRTESVIKKEIFPLFSVAISVYGKDNPKWVDRALESIINQTLRPDEIVLVVDGKIPETIELIIEKYRKKCVANNIFLNILRLEKNCGLGNALRVAVQCSKNQWIARMDSDDISLPDRFEQQMRYIVNHPDIDIIGGDITEFIGSEENIVGKRSVPKSDKAIREYMKTRCAMNHVSVMYKKHSVLRAGGYKEWFWNEDYFLWLRMMECNCRFANTGTVLVNVRVGEDMYSRRGGIKYCKSELKLQTYMLNKKLIGIHTFIFNCVKRIVVQILMPNKIRGWVFRALAREKY